MKKRDKYWSRYISIYLTSFHYLIYITFDTQKLDFSTAQFSPAELEKQNKDLVNHANDFLTDEDSELPVFLEPEEV